MFRRTLLTAVCAGFCIAASDTIASAQAQDRWTGLYGGGHLGGASAYNADATIAPANAATQAFLGPFIATGAIPTNYSVDPDGVLAGLAMGYNWAFGSFLIGMEADWSVTSVEDSRNIVTNAAFPLNRFDTDVNWVSTVRGRLGVLAGPRLLLYATGGFAFGEVEQTFIWTDANGNSLNGTSTDTLTGYAVGGGAEWALSGNWSIKGEYLYMSLDDNDFVTGPAGGACGATNCVLNVDTDEIDVHTARLGINYKFGHHEPPVEPLK